jgi:hypothetical protein
MQTETHPVHEVVEGHSSTVEHAAHGDTHGATIHLPAGTAWPIVLAFGFTLLVSGVLTHYVIGILGGVLMVAGCYGWFKEVLPHEAHVDIPVTIQEVAVTSTRRSIARIGPSGDGNRQNLPVTTFPVLTGLKGGIAGGIAMVIPAEIYGLIAQHSLWYPINLLGGAGVAHWRNPSIAEISAFHAESFFIAVVIHVASCVLIGLLYGATLPMMPKHPIVLGGILAPLLWTGLLHATLHTINPEFADHIQWGWFTLSQLIFGLVAGYVVSKSDYMRTQQALPFSMRLGLETTGMAPHHHHEDGN